MMRCQYIFFLVSILSFAAIAKEDLVEPKVSTKEQITLKDDTKPVETEKGSDDAGEMGEAKNRMVTDLEDPTRISDSFQSALKRLTPKAAENGGASPARISVIPKIELAAIIDGYGKKRTALLKWKDKTHMVRKGQSFSLIESNVVYEVYIEDIDLCEIKLNVSPPNQLIILR